MSYQKYNFKLLHTILSIGFSEDFLVFVDTHYGVYLYAPAIKKIVFGKRVLQRSIKHHIYSKAVACSKNGDLLIAGANSKVCGLFAVQNQELKKKQSIQWHKADISSMVFSQDSKLFATGGEDGKIFVYTTFDAKFFAILPAQAEYISCMNFDGKSRYLAFATFENKIFLFDLLSHNITAEFDTRSVAESLNFFDNDGKIIYVCKNGEIGVIDLLNKKQRIKGVLNIWLQHCLVHPNEKYAYITGRSNKLIIYKIENNSIFMELDLAENGVSFMQFVGDLLCICFVSGNVVFLDQKHCYDEFKILLESKNYEEAKNFAETNNVFLKLEELYYSVRLENWQDVLKDILNLFLNNQADSALDIATPYLEDWDLEKEFRYYFDEKEVVAEFLLMIKREQYAQAYAMANKKRGLRNLRLFQELENYFSCIFEASKKMLEEDANHATRVKKILEPFMEVNEKKDMIIFLLNNFLQYQYIEKAFRDKDYEECFKLAQKFPFLQKSKAYYGAMQICSNLLYQLKEKSHTHSFDSLQKSIEFLDKIPFFQDEVRALSNFLLKQEDLKKSFHAKKMHDCYTLLKQNPDLYSSDIYFELESHVLQALKNALDFAKQGETSRVYEILGQFIALDVWKGRVESIFQISYFYEIKYGDTHEAVNWYETIKKYINFFGKTSEFKVLCDSRGLQEVFDEILEIKDKNVEFLPTILVKE
ncbi:WD40 repeat domain-containing protein [Helicobacter anatolicus]|uniref:hypothetical protein n=1 Tax=Helicobacter anatolicus TaxID=2905874 RepID=UPI001E5B0A51|nr:hypothetical protein [Helicobacter anatolicus]MCE3037953.1 hypothetical protein [Helicobacter anatolicus]